MGDVYYFCAALCARVAYLVSEVQAVPQRQVLLDDNGLVRCRLAMRGRIRERLG